MVDLYDIYKKTLADHPVLTRDQERIYLEKAVLQGDVEARGELVRHLGKYLVDFANRHTHGTKESRREQFIDFLQVGLLAGYEALDKYSFEKNNGGRFLTYAKRRIMKRVLEAKEQHWTSNKMRIIHSDCYIPLSRVCEYLANVGVKKPTVEDVKAALVTYDGMRISEPQRKALLKNEADTLEYQLKMYHAEKLLLSEDNEPTRHVQFNERKGIDDIEGLDDRTKLIFKLRTDGLTYKEIGDITGLTRERIRQIFLEGAALTRELVNGSVDEFFN